MIAIYLVLINLLAYSIMWLDKRAARLNQWRTPEKVMFQIALIGGAVGISIGMKHVRHKTQKTNFKVGIPLLILMNIITIIGGLLLFDKYL
nr:DUF1294 domain-containing protein [Evansella vedderi]